MKIAKIICLCCAFLMFFGFVYIPDGILADSEPVVSNVFHIPKYPIISDNVTVFATITDSDGIDKVQLGHCNETVCYSNVPMAYIGDDVYSAAIAWNDGWRNGTVIGYDFYITDNGLNYTSTEYIYYFIVSEINMSIDIPDFVYFGDPVILNGTASYNGNRSAPVEDSNVTVRIDELEMEYYSMTDNNGNFSILLPFDTPGEYQINVTLTNRTMYAYNVTSVMLFGITYFSEKLQMTTIYPDQKIWVNGTAKYNTDDPVINSDIELKINETLIWTGKTDSSGNYAILITPPSELGNYNINASVTNGSLVKYNETSITVTAVPLPDLYISPEDINVTSDYTPHLAGKEIEIEVKIHNLGLADVSNVTIAIYNGPISEDNRIVQNDDIGLSYGSYATYSLIWTTVNGTYEIYFYLDPQDAIKESFEDNNNASVSIFVDGDFDGDLIGNTADPDDDNDGVTDDVDAFPTDANEWLDTDLDGKGNNLDLDDDGDGISDAKENMRGTDPLKSDTDGDGVNDGSDYEPLDPEVWEKPDDPGSSFPWILLIIIIVVVVLMVVFLLMTRRKEEYR